LQHFAIRPEILVLLPGLEVVAHDLFELGLQTASPAVLVLLLQELVELVLEA